MNPPVRHAPGRHLAPADTQHADVFVNPYTFVPFVKPGEAFRREPAGHDQLGQGRYLGEITVCLTARSPLLLRSITKEHSGKFPRRGGVPFLPGSSLAGAIRSMHELVAGGCLRVFDHEFVPGYRDPAVMRDRNWRLVRVEEVDESGRPTKLTVCAAGEVWVTAKALAQALGGARNVVSGATVDVERPDTKAFANRTGDRASRLEATRGPNDQDPQVRAGGGWVVLVTDSGTRKPTGRGARRQYKSFYCAAGKLTTAAATLSDEAWRNYQVAIADTDDMRRARGAKNKPLRPSEPVPTEVRHSYADGARQVVGSRHEARPVLFPGQVLWGRLDNTKTIVEELALAAIWRHPGKYPAGERVPDGLLPCRDPDRLCPTCRVFGSVDALGGDEAAQQRSYKGHLRFSDALPTSDVEICKKPLPAFGAPRPGAGQFYLNTPAEGAAPDVPLREWGSAADRPPAANSPRQLNGRKQYWLTGRHGERPFFRVTTSFESDLATTAEAAKEGAQFTFTVRFDGLTMAELGALLAALAPQLLFKKGRRRIGIALGGGRPLGFGTCTTKITSLVVENARSRYLGEARPMVDVAAAVESFRDQACPEVADTWPCVAKALHLDHVDPAEVWYPPASGIPEGRLSATALEPGFEFWRRSRGLRYSSANRADDRLVQLPRIDADHQELTIPQRENRGRQ